MSNPQPFLILLSNEDEEETDYRELKDIVKLLMSKGFEVYNSQLHWAEFKRDFHCCLHQNFNIKCSDYPNHIGCPDYFPEPNYVERDLALLDSWCSPIEDDTIQHLILDMTTEMSHPSYQPKVVGVILPSALYSIQQWKQFLDVGGIDKEDNIDFLQKFDPNLSKGVIKEYRFMHSKHILVISLETALTIPPDRWKELAL